MNSDFKDLLTILNDCQVSCLVVGGYAYIHYSEPRYTKDIDLWIMPSAENALRLREALLRFGGWVEGMTLDHFTTERTMFQIGLPPCRVDFLTSIPGFEFTPAYAARKSADLDVCGCPSYPWPILSPPNALQDESRICATSPDSNPSFIVTIPILMDAKGQVKCDLFYRCKFPAETISTLIVQNPFTRIPSHPDVTSRCHIPMHGPSQAMVRASLTSAP